MSPELAGTAVTPPLDGAAIDNGTSGIGDLSVTGLVGWHRDKPHFSTGLTVYKPTGDYEKASVNLRSRTLDTL